MNGEVGAGRREVENEASQGYICDETATVVQRLKKQENSQADRHLVATE